MKCRVDCGAFNGDVAKFYKAWATVFGTCIAGTVRDRAGVGANRKGLTGWAEEKVTVFGLMLFRR